MNSPFHSPGSVGMSCGSASGGIFHWFWTITGISNAATIAGVCCSIERQLTKNIPLPFAHRLLFNLYINDLAGALLVGLT